MRFTKRKIISCEIGANFEVDDVLISLKLLFLGFLYKFGNSLERSKAWFADYLGHKNIKSVWMVDSGRTALYLLLKTLNLPKESEVVIQGFSCIVVPNAVLQAGLVPVVCDIEKKTYNIDFEDIESKLTKKTKVLIIQHSFGLSVDLKKAEEFCQKHDLILVEDCAHAIGAKSGRRNLGSVGDAAIFSLGRDKVVSSTVGGAAAINNNDQGWIDRFQNEYENLPKLKTFDVFRSLYYVILTKVFVRPFYYFFNLGKFFIFISQKLKLVDSIYTKKEEQGTSVFESGYKYSPVLAVLLNNQLKKLEKFNDHRKELSKIYSQTLGLDYNKDNIYMRYPLDVGVLAGSQSPEKVAKLHKKIKSDLRYKESVLLGNWYYGVFLPTTVDLKKINCDPTKIPICSKLSNQRFLNLPTNICTSKADAQRIANKIKKLAE